MGRIETDNAPQICPACNVHKRKSPVARAIRWFTCLAVLYAASIALDTPLFSHSFLNNLPASFDWSRDSFTTRGEVCKPPSPNVFATNPPRPSNDFIVKVSREIDNYISKRSSKPDIDSISIAVVTLGGSIFERGYGVLKANESDVQGPLPVGPNSIYRLASISKMFTTLETLILRERGILNWDDPVEKFLPDFSPPSESYGWSSYLDGLQSNGENPASLSDSIGRDYPPSDLEDWPHTKFPGDTASVFEREYDEIIKAVSEFPLVNAPYTYPIYSNTGFDLLGLSNVAANLLASSDPSKEPQTHKELLKRDIFDPLQLNSSFFRVPEEEELKSNIAVPSKDSKWADIPLGDVDDPAGGQYSSLRDLETLMKTFLSPTGKGGLLPAHVIREWLHPLHVWGSTSQQVGAPWEIFSIAGSTVYTKGGNLPGYHSVFAIVPEYSVGIIILVTGTYSDTDTLLKEVGQRLLPALEKLHQVELRRRYVGTWTNGNDVAEIGLVRGVLYLKKLIIGKVDVLKAVEDMNYGLVEKNGSPVALWATGRVGEFRLAFGRPALNKLPDIACFPYWLSIDNGLNSRGAPIDLLFWKNGVLTYPSGGVSFARKR
ncbi:beta-lactamase/transpeptidase-like protein [Gymnopilus junonius]|uniref:Beta-lactamase/transpeptidase-like protein n=1 Tax=Gymnopilus junonius TaxID=109634 RepID=A0A9P5TKZ8_GYMJU|nr:beta-lactamase/transpeptidase-like protein [Gymnopilus junonius]